MFYGRRTKDGTEPDALCLNVYAPYSKNDLKIPNYNGLIRTHVCFRRMVWRGDPWKCCAVVVLQAACVVFPLHFLCEAHARCVHRSWWSQKFWQFHLYVTALQMWSCKVPRDCANTSFRKWSAVRCLELSHKWFPLKNYTVVLFLTAGHLPVVISCVFTVWRSWKKYSFLVVAWQQLSHIFRFVLTRLVCPVTLSEHGCLVIVGELFFADYAADQLLSFWDRRSSKTR